MMGFTIVNKKDILIIKPSLLSGFLGHKLMIHKNYLKKGAKLVDIKTGKEYDVEGIYWG